eukprot:XP_016874124.1 uncharacterized protein LOC107987158 [Homo sapiens]
MCPGPNPRYLWMWPCLESGSVQMLLKILSPRKPGQNRAGPWQAPVCVPCPDLPVLDTAWAWKRTRCGLWYLASLTWCISAAHPCRRMCECRASCLLKAECSSIRCTDVIHVYPFTHVDVWLCPLSDGPEPCCWERACADHLGACACFSWVCRVRAFSPTVQPPMGPWSRSLVHALGCTCLLCPAPHLPPLPPPHLPPLPPSAPASSARLCTCLLCPALHLPPLPPSAPASSARLCTCLLCPPLHLPPLPRSAPASSAPPRTCLLCPPLHLPPLPCSAGSRTVQTQMLGPKGLCSHTPTPCAVRCPG